MEKKSLLEVPDPKLDMTAGGKKRRLVIYIDPEKV